MGESKVIHKQPWDIQEGFILTYLSFLINRVKLNTRKALLPWMKFYPRGNVTDYAVSSGIRQNVFAGSLTV